LVGLWGGIWWHTRSLARQRIPELANARETALDLQRRLEAGRYDDTLGVAHSLYERFPELPEACLIWAQAQFRLGWQTDRPLLESQAIIFLQSGPLEDQWAWAARALLAEVYQRTGARGADELEARVREEAADTADAWYLRSFATLDIAKARQAIQRALEIDPKHRPALRRWAYLCYQVGDIERARHAAQELIALGENPCVWMQFEGHALLKCGRYEEALEQYQQVVTRYPAKRAELCRPSAVAHLCLRQYEEAIRECSGAVSLKLNGQPYAYYVRATPLWITGRMAEAADDYRTFRRLESRTTFADARLFLVLMDWANRLDEAGRQAEAQPVRQQAAQTLKHVRAVTGQGSWLAQVAACLAGESTPEQLAARGAESRDLEHICEGYYYAGEVCLLAGQKDRARAWFQTCKDTGLVFDLDEFPPDAMSEYHLALWRLEQLCGNTGPSSRPDGG
jgi:tetratricopeptide (TPR) repeat protein